MKFRFSGPGNQKISLESEIFDMLNKNDFVEVEYIGKTKDGNIFDTNIKEEAKKIELNIETRPLIICLGQNMILQAIDEFLIGNEVENYTLELRPEKAFGIRRKELVKIMPISVFKNSDISPRQGMIFSFDNLLGKITAISGGRVIVDFNNPLAGKEVIYELKIKRVVTDEKEKIKTLMLAFFGKEFEFKIENKKLIIESSPEFSKFVLLFKPKFKEILNLDLETSELQESKILDSSQNQENPPKVGFSGPENSKRIFKDSKGILKSKDSEGAQKFERTERISDIKEIKEKKEGVE